MKTNYSGIDYSGRGATCNRNAEGIRYGILPVNTPELTEWFWESVEPIYHPACPHCGRQLDENWEDTAKVVEVASRYDRYVFREMPACPHCDEGINTDWSEQYSDEPDANVLAGCDEKGFVDSSNDIWVTDSPYFTYAQFCSPCAPGACYLRSPLDVQSILLTQCDVPTEDRSVQVDSPEGAEILTKLGIPRCFCLGPDWFEGQPPYDIYSVKTGKLLHKGVE